MDRQLRCVAHRTNGLTFAEIAEEEGYASESGARAACRAVWKRAAVTATDELRAMLADRGERLWVAGLRVMDDGVEMMAQGKEELGLKKFEVGHRAAERALGRLILIHGVSGPVQQPEVEGAPSLEEIKRAFDAAVAGRGEPPIDVEVVPDPVQGALGAGVPGESDADFGEW